VALNAGFSVQSLFLSSAGITRSVSSKPMCATTKAGHGAAVGVGNGMVTKVRLGLRRKGGANRAIVGALGGI
jgi:hypothetical protein